MLQDKSDREMTILATPDILIVWLLVAIVVRVLGLPCYNLGERLDKEVTFSINETKANYYRGSQEYIKISLKR